MTHPTDPSLTTRIKKGTSMRSKTQRRIIAIAAAAVTVALGVAGCSGGAATTAGGDQPALSKDKVTITLNWWGADARNQNTLDAIALFEKKYPNITVDPTNADWTGYWDKLATATAGGDMPDVSQFDQLYLASYADRGSLLDLSTVSNTLKTDYLSDGVLGSGLVSGKQYAVPIGVTPSGIIINQSILEKYGIALPDITTWTWDEFNSLTAEITEKSGGSEHGLTPFGGDSFSLGVWARQHGNNIFDSDGKVTLKASVLSSYWQQELDWIKSEAAPSASSLSETATAVLDQTDLATGKTAMAFIPAGQFSAYQSANPDAKFTMANWPTSSDTKDGFQYLKPSMYWAISAKTEHPAESALLVDFLMTDPGVGKAFGVDRGVPSNPDIQKAITPELSPSDQINLNFTADMTKVAGESPAITPNGASAIETSLARYNQDVLFGKSSPDDAAKAFIDELQGNITSAG
jgi:multiple sugar transport system substrate-binding protein